MPLVVPKKGVRYPIEGLEPHAPEFVKYLKSGYKNLSMELIKGQPGVSILVSINGEPIECEWQIRSGKKLIGKYCYAVEPIDGEEILRKTFEFADSHIRLRWSKNTTFLYKDGRDDDHRKIPFP